MRIPATVVGDARRVPYGSSIQAARERERIGLVINDIPTVESKAPSQFGGVLLASARHAPLAPDKGYNTHDTLSGVHRSLGALF